MSAQLMTALVLFAISISITPGAGNIALLGISSRYGFAAAMPFVLGNAVGIIIVLAGSSVGLVGLFTVYPSLHAILKFVGAAYLLYLAWSISKQKIDTSISSHPSGFLFRSIHSSSQPERLGCRIDCFLSVYLFNR